MRKDDLPVIVCRILLYLYDCLKSGVQPEESEVSPEVLGICRSYWNDVLRFMQDGGLTRGGVVIRNGTLSGMFVPQMKITMAGERFLRTHPDMLEAREFLKSLEIEVPGL